MILLPAHGIFYTRSLIGMHAHGRIMKLQKERKSVDGKNYSRWAVIVPRNQIAKLGWKEGDILEQKIEGNKLITELLTIRKQ